MRLSIVIPVYNVENWIERCLRSCMNQGIPITDFEIVVVNDGTKDNSMNIVKHLQKEIPNIVIINQTNRGLSVARNTGLAASKGYYVWFIDSDDSIEEMCGCRLLSYAEKNQLDVLCFGINLQYENGRKEPFVINYKNREYVFSGQDFICNVEMPPAVWCAIYRRDFLIEHNLNFYPNIFHEDFEFTPRAYSLAERIMYVDEHVYNYEQRAGSIMNSNDKAIKKESDLLVVCDSLYAFAQEHLEEGSDVYNCFISKINFAFSQSLKNHVSSIFDVSKFKSKEYYPLNVCHIDNKIECLKYKLINFSLPLYILLVKLRNSK